MNVRVVCLVSVICFSFFPVQTFGQCKNQQDRHCWNLQYILYAAQTDFREFRAPEPPHPDASVGAAEVPCHISAWLNDVAMYLCHGQIPLADGEEWYAKTMADLQQLQYLWHFRIKSAGTDHYVNAGPPGCEVAPLDGPYIKDGPYLGECPLHLQVVKQAAGTDEVYLWINSYSSSYLVRNPFAPSRSAILTASDSQSIPLPESSTRPADQPSPTSDSSSPQSSLLC
jgi:hypothetical protein